MKKTQILSAGVPLAALLLAYSSTKADAAGIRGSILLPDRPLQELTSIHHRRLEDANDDANDDGYADDQRGDEVENEDEQVEEVEDENDEDEGEAFETEDAGSNYGVSGTTTATIQAKVEQYEAEAAQIFETAPAEWSVGQWDMFFALFGAILVTCCVISAFFAYCCIFREDDDVYSRKVRRRRRHKKKDDETVATEYTKDMSLLNPSESQTCAESRVYSPRIHKGAFSPKSWVSGGFSGEDTVVTRDDSMSYTAPSVSNVSNKSNTFDDDIPRQNTSTSDAENTNVLAM